MAMHQLLENLNSEQREAVLATEGPVLVLVLLRQGYGRTANQREEYVVG
jgi:hypothetical protein